MNTYPANSSIVLVVPHLEFALVNLLPLALALAHIGDDFCDRVNDDDRYKYQEKGQTLRHDRTLGAR